jgi:glycosyltransferase involved in cell wall biosynthesis
LKLLAATRSSAPSASDTSSSATRATARTFIVTEILAHETAGLDIEIFSLSPPNDTHFQDVISRVRAPVTYLTCDGLKAVDFWSALQKLGASSSGCWSMLESARGYEVKEVHQAIQLALLVRARGITHLHAHFATSATSVARLAARFAGIGFTFTAHAKDIFHQSVVEVDLRQKLADADATITVSDYNARFLRGSFGADAARVKRVYNGLDLANLRFESPDSRPPVILAAGRLVEKKGFADLINACALLAADGRSFQCKIVGAGDLEAALRAQIERQRTSRARRASRPAAAAGSVRADPLGGGVRGAVRRRRRRESRRPANGDPRSDGAGHALRFD